MNAAEQWRSVVGYVGLYEVSSLGRVRSLDRVSSNGRTFRGICLNPGTNNRGYRRVSLCSSGSTRTRCVHKIVAEAFLGPLPEGLQTRHLNGDRDDNRLANLAYGTQSENQMDNVRHGTHHKTRQKACIRGHILSGDNLAIYGGKRKCRTCNKDRNRQWRDRRSVA